MANPNFLNDKYTPATLPEVCAPRHALLDCFHQAAQSRLVYVCAPAGYGKTVSTLLWLEVAKRKAIWIGLDRYDNGLSVFYRLLSNGIFSIQPNNTGMEQILRSPTFSSSPVEHTVAMLAEFLPDEEQYALVLDDMHLINNEEILKSLPIIRERLPHSFVVILLTRNSPTKRMYELKESGRADIITPEQLKFTKEEIQKYFYFMGRFLSPEELNAAHLYTDGWPMGVNALAQSGLFAGEHGGQALENYINQQIWDSWDEERRSFCLNTSILDEMPIALVEQLTGNKDSRALLDHLCAENAFISKLNDDTYRYHHLFLDYLRKLCKKQKIDQSALYKICADYFKAQQNHLMALRYWVKTGDYKGIGPYFYPYVFDESNRAMVENIEYFATFFIDFPDAAFKEYPALRISRVWYSYVTGDYEGMEYHLDALYKSIPAIALKTPEYMEYVALAYSVDHRQNFASQIKRFSWIGRFIKNFSGGVVTKSIVSFAHNLPYMHRSNRDYCDLVIAEDDIVDRLSNTFGKILGTEWTYVKPGLLACFAYEQNDLHKALSLAIESNERFDNSINSVEGLFCANIILHSAHEALGHIQEANQALQGLAKLVDQEQYFIPNFTAYKTRYELWNGEKQAARDWLDNYFVTQGKQIELYRVFQHFVTARAYLLLNDTKQAYTRLKRLKEFGIHYHRPLDQAEADVLLSILHWSQGEKAQAITILEAVLKAMQPYGFIRVIADEGASIKPILKKISTKIARPDYKGSLSSTYVGEVLLAAHAISKQRRGIDYHLIANGTKVKLSRQQKLMVELLAQGYRPQQIGEVTGLKMPTVKTHLSLAYEKLGVNNSLDAVLRARELGLIEH